MADCVHSHHALNKYREQWNNSTLVPSLVMKYTHTLSRLSPCVSDIDTVECLVRPYDVHSHTLSVPNVGVEGVCTYSKLVQPTLTSHILYTGQPVKKTPGHTGFLTFATLTHKHC